MKMKVIGVLISISLLLMLFQGNGGFAMQSVYQTYFYKQLENSGETKYVRIRNIQKAIMSREYLYICIKGENNSPDISNKIMLVSQTNGPQIQPFLKEGNNLFTVKIKLYEYFRYLFTPGQDTYIKNNISYLNTVNISASDIVKGCESLEVTNKTWQEVPVVNFSSGNTRLWIEENNQKENFIINDYHNSGYVALYEIDNKRYDVAYRQDNFYIESIGETELKSFVIGALLIIPATLLDLITLPFQILLFLIVATGAR